jgi:hypothetical protein
MSETDVDEPSVETIDPSVETIDPSVETIDPSVKTPVEIPTSVTEPIVKPKRKRTEKQIAQLQVARTKAAKKRKLLSKPVKIERKEVVPEPSGISSDFSWKKETLKTVLVGSLGLASIYVQRQLAQKPIEVPEEKKVEIIVPLKKQKKVTEPNRDPFGSYRQNPFVDV